MSKLWNYVDAQATGLGDLVAMAAALGLVALFVMGLGGCAEIGRYSADDAARAATIAAAVGDTAGAGCWPVLEATGNATSAAGDEPGILTAIEEKRALAIALQNPVCEPVWASVLAQLLKATPAAPFVP